MVDPKQHDRNLKQIAKTIAEVNALVNRTSARNKPEPYGSPRPRADTRSKKSSQKKK